MSKDNVLGAYECRLRELDVNNWEERAKVTWPFNVLVSRPHKERVQVLKGIAMTMDLYSYESGNIDLFDHEAGMRGGKIMKPVDLPVWVLAYEQRGWSEGMEDEHDLGIMEDIFHVKTYDDEHDAEEAFKEIMDKNVRGKYPEDFVVQDDDKHLFHAEGEPVDGYTRMVRVVLSKHYVGCCPEVQENPTNWQIKIHEI